MTYAVDVDANCDRFPVEWLFHHRWGKKPGKVDGEFLKEKNDSLEHGHVHYLAKLATDGPRRNFAFHKMNCGNYA